MAGQTLLVGLAHPDDEVGAAGTICAQVARGDRVVVVWLTRGEMTEAFGPVSMDEVSRLREEHGRMAGELLGCETRFLDFRDTGVEATPESARRVARLIAEVKPDGILTWGDAWGRGMRHPDHQATGKIFRDAVTLARLAKVVAPAAPHREPAPVFTYRGAYSHLPAAVVDVEPWVDRIHALAGFYYERIGFGNADWVERRLRAAAEPHGLRYAEVFDAWETPGGHFATLLPAAIGTGDLPHPTR
ncbi:MAG TPA: PIG-L deacetylase family protein, partial [Longimicrobiaceae bacterium]|nr:PIG-L deacetylase family protein [Longimicrobiaceae bacterium]